MISCFKTLGLGRREDRKGAEYSWEIREKKEENNYGMFLTNTKGRTSTGDKKELPAAKVN